MTTRPVLSFLAALTLAAALGSHAPEVAAQPSPTDPAAAADVTAIVDRIQEVYDAVGDFRARFTQEYTNAALGETDTSSGVVHFLKPGMMRWDYSAPVARLFIIDGTSLWIYEPTEGQYYTQPLDDSELPTALRFLMGRGEFAEDFDITLVEQTDARVVLDLVPRADEGEYRKLRFVVNATTWRIDETVIYDPIGNTNRFVFSEREENVGYVAGDFAFEPPAGATRLETPSP
jgi:outer membrane lipoprotein carrier protein